VALSPDGLRLTRLALRNFRNYPALRIAIAAQAIVLTGPNGGGKTNLLEAISLLSSGRGLRHVAFGEVVRHGARGVCHVLAELSGPHGDVALGASFRSATQAGTEAAEPARRVTIDGITQRSSGALDRYMKIVWLTPSLDRLFSGPPSGRRRFLDRLVSVIDPEHAERFADFERLMGERNRLLAEAAWDKTWLTGIEQQMAELGVALGAARLAALEALQAPAGAGGAPRLFPWAELAVAGEIEALLGEAPAIQAEDHYRKMLHDSRSSDRAAGRTLHGPHRSDFLVTHGPKAAAAAACSTGEQKALLISIVLAHARAMRETALGVLPILLFDEGITHLDGKRRAGLFETVSGLGAQCWFTGTDRALFAGLEGEAQYYSVEDGVLTPTE
jgi:DNA replication and repair protein RecF